MLEHVVVTVPCNIGTCIPRFSCYLVWRQREAVAVTTVPGLSPRLECRQEGKNASLLFKHIFMSAYIPAVTSALLSLISISNCLSITLSRHGPSRRDAAAGETTLHSPQVYLGVVNKPCGKLPTQLKSRLWRELGWVTIFCRWTPIKRPSLTNQMRFVRHL